MSEEEKYIEEQEEKNYSASNIQVLEGLEAVRKVRLCTSVTPTSRVCTTW